MQLGNGFNAAACVFLSVLRTDLGEMLALVVVGDDITVKKNQAFRVTSGAAL